jgi:hypothetical protein
VFFTLPTSEKTFVPELNHTRRIRIDQHFVKRLISTDCNVFLNVIGIDETTVPQNNFLLPFEEWHVAPRRDFGISLTVAHVTCNVIPLFNLAVNRIRAETAIGNIVQDTRGVVSLHPTQNDQRITGKPNVHEGLLKASSETTYRRQNEISATVFNRLQKCLIQAFSAVSATTCSHSHSQTRYRRDQFGKARLTHCAERSNIQNARHCLLSGANGCDLTLQGTLGGMSADAMVHLHYGRHRALTEAGHRTHCELTVRGGEQKFVGIVAVAVRILETQPKI